MRKGQKHTEYSKKKISATKSDSRRVYQFTLSGDFIRSYPTYLVAKEILGLKNAHGILLAADRSILDHLSAYGYRWSFTNRLHTGCRPLTPKENLRRFNKHTQLKSEFRQKYT